MLKQLNKELHEFDTVLFKVNDQVYTKSTAVFKIIDSVEVGLKYSKYLIYSQQNLMIGFIQKLQKIDLSILEN